jgi:hypothetical protein
MNRFLLLWSLISPTCSCLIVGWAFKRQSAWDFTGQFDMYLAYWIVLALGQSLLLWWVYRQRSLAVQWFITTALAGTAIMQSHDLLLALTGIDPRGQGLRNGLSKSQPTSINKSGGRTVKFAPVSINSFTTFKQSSPDPTTALVNRKFWRSCNG